MEGLDVSFWVGIGIQLVVYVLSFIVAIAVMRVKLIYVEKEVDKVTEIQKDVCKEVTINTRDIKSAHRRIDELRADVHDNHKGDV